MTSHYNDTRVRMCGKHPKLCKIHKSPTTILSTYLDTKLKMHGKWTTSNIYQG